MKTKSIIQYMNNQLKKDSIQTMRVGLPSLMTKSFFSYKGTSQMYFHHLCKHWLLVIFSTIKPILTFCL